MEKETRCFDNQQVFQGNSLSIITWCVLQLNTFSKKSAADLQQSFH